MEYTLDVLIAATPQEVAAAYADPATWTQWQPGLVEVTPLVGTRGTPGARTALRFEFPGHAMEMVETQQHVELPHRYDAIYSSGPVTNFCSNTFAPTPDGSTAWTQHNGWEFDGVDANEDDEERFRATTLSMMHGFRAWVEQSHSPA